MPVERPHNSYTRNPPLFFRVDHLLTHSFGELLHVFGARRPVVGRIIALPPLQVKSPSFFVILKAFSGEPHELCRPYAAYSEGLGICLSNLACVMLLLGEFCEETE